MGSRLLGLVTFLLSVTNHQGGVGAYRDVFAHSRFAQFTTPAIRQFRRLELDERTATYVGYPDTHGQSVGPWTQFLPAVVKTTETDDLQDRTAGLFSNATQEIILRAMDDLSPVYDSLIWLPSATDLEHQRAGLRDDLSAHDVSSVFATIGRFYGTEWPPSLPLWIALYPLPSTSGFGATAIANVAFGGLPRGFRDYDTYASIVLHEVSHQLFAQEPPSTAWHTRQHMLAGTTVQPGYIGNTLVREHR